MQTKGPVPGFSKGVNDALVAAATLVHLKAAGQAHAARRLEKLVSPEAIDREYAFTNYRLSAVLDSKYTFIRWAICLLLAGSALAGAGLIMEFKV